MKQKKNIAAIVTDLALPVAENLGYILWDVEYAKEGADMVLRITIDTDKPEGITIEDCEKMNHAIDPLLDEADPIEESYMLSVSSPGVDRDLTKPMHFERCAGKTVEIRLFAAIDGSKTFKGQLVGLQKTDGENETEIVITTPDGEKRFPEKSVAKCSVAVDW